VKKILLLVSIAFLFNACSFDQAKPIVKPRCKVINLKLKSVGRCNIKYTRVSKKYVKLRLTNARCVVAKIHRLEYQNKKLRIALDAMNRQADIGRTAHE